MHTQHEQEELDRLIVRMNAKLRTMQEALRRVRPDTRDEATYFRAVRNQVRDLERDVGSLHRLSRRMDRS